MTSFCLQPQQAIAEPRERQIPPRIERPPPQVIATIHFHYQPRRYEGSAGVRHYADLSSLDRTYCYPRDDAAWRQVSPDSYGLGLIWVSRFEVHVDQVIGLAERTEPIERSA